MADYVQQFERISERRGHGFFSSQPNRTALSERCVSEMKHMIMKTSRFAQMEMSRQ